MSDMEIETDDRTSQCDPPATRVLRRPSSTLRALKDVLSEEHDIVDTRDQNDQKANMSKNISLVKDIKVNTCSICCEEKQTLLCHCLVSDSLFCQDCLVLYILHLRPHRRVFGDFIPCPAVSCSSTLTVLDIRTVLSRVDFAIDGPFVWYILHTENDLESATYNHSEQLAAISRTITMTVSNGRQTIIRVEQRSQTSTATPAPKEKSSTRVLSRLWLLLHAKKCPHCAIYVQKVDGCPHVRCLCGYEYCWDCGQSWQTHKFCGGIGLLKLTVYVVSAPLWIIPLLTYKGLKKLHTVSQKHRYNGSLRARGGSVHRCRISSAPGA